MFQVAIFVKNCKFRMKCVEKYDASAFGATQLPWLFLDISVFQQNSKFLTNFKMATLLMYMCVCPINRLIAAVGEHIA